ncbi:pilus assembly protein [Marinosulfonomonas sp. PRT-SC04]|nr:pilus assembly protein [Marinosulfonomonas sp. PRT-SC04]
MTSKKLEILRREALTQGGFAGLKEHRLVMDKKLWGDRTNPSAWSGIANFVYLADAQFDPKGEATMHPHKEIDVISVMVEGRVAHQGSLEHGESLDTNDAQVQRAGGEGFEHNEMNPDETKNRMLQLWVMPEVKGEPAGYKKFSPAWGETTRIYGGSSEDTLSFAAKTTIDVAMLTAGQSIELTTPYLAYVAKGDGTFEAQELTGGDLIRGADGTFTATTDVQFILIGSLT